MQPEANMQPDERIHHIAQFVKSRLEQMVASQPDKSYDFDYRWHHILRVTQYGRQIALAEGAPLELVLAGCLLHDVSHFDPIENQRDHGRVGAQVARPLLEELGYSPEQIDEIAYAVAWHVDGEAGYEHPRTLVANCVTDADNVDRFGAYRILQVCRHQMDDLAKLAEFLQGRIARHESYLEKSPMETRTGARLFADQIRQQLAVYKAILAEWELSKLPEIDSQG